ncbi:MAG: hypothetical protein ACHQ5A_03655 [Opitutales bacterium]
MSTAPPAPIATVDAQHPWLGLVSFTEETRGYFHGREEEAAELSRRVQRKLLTVLFGQSGLGKTSILQAGLVPRLRPEGFCPVYVRLDYDPQSPPPAEQIKRAVFRATEAAGTWTQSGTAVAGETLWEFLHHRDDVLKDAAGRTLIPILIFDQFEEIFTLAQSDDAGRRRAQEFLADLADLVENRPPAALEARIERDEADAARFDFARADYRILISLREDYLAHLEGLKGRMPAVTQNRMRLARMTGAQAVAAVRTPAPHLVGEAVAEAVVRFVAGTAELNHAEVEPSLLSLICRELNDTRLAKGESEISADLLAGSRDTILSEFYERTLADQPAGVRIFIEDEMLTDSGFRESVAEERVRKAFVAAGAKPETLAQLVDRRLLRVEDRLDMRRVEITHDVLCSVIGASRNVRREREALEESKRQIAAQQERERATQRALVRARIVAAVATVLMLAAAGSAIFGWINLRRARAAEVQTQEARDLAERARSDSEKLVGFLLEDFYEELQPTGRVEIVGELADKAVAYYNGLPPELMTAQTKLYHGMALVRKASAQSAGGREADATRTANAARKLIEELRTENGVSDENTMALALAIFAKSSGAMFFRHKTDLEEAAGLLRPLVASGRASRTAKLTYADTLNFMAHTQERKVGLAMCEESRHLLADLGALDLSDLTAAAIYGDVTDTQSRIAERLGRLDEAQRLAKIVGELAEKVLTRRPGDLRAMMNRYFSANTLGNVAYQRSQFQEAEAQYTQELAAARNYALFNPAESQAWRLWSGSNIEMGDTLMQQGRITDALQQYHEATSREHDPRNQTGVEVGLYNGWRLVMHMEAQLGNLRSARAALAETRRIGATIVKERGFDEELTQLVALNSQAQEFDIMAVEGDYAGIHARALDLAARLGKLPKLNDGNQWIRQDAVRLIRGWVIDAALRLGLGEEALAVARQAVADPQTEFVEANVAERVVARAQVRLGQAALAAGQRAESRGSLREALAYYRAELERGATGTTFGQDLARALTQMALAQDDDPSGLVERGRLLEEASARLDQLSPEARQLRESQELIKDVQLARQM